MTKRSRRLLLLAAVAGLAMLVAVGWLLWPRTAITRENVARIEVGMTLAEVEAILGGPARDDTTGPVLQENERDMVVGGKGGRTDKPRRTLE